MRARPFDELAGAYDATFSEAPIGRTLRQLVWVRLERAFAPPCRILELGCGTGEDALHLARGGCDVVAIDSSVNMIEVARRKVLRDGRASRVEFHCRPMEQLETALRGGPRFDGVLSNFGAINCVADLRHLVLEVSRWLRPGARLVWIVMGRHVPWEWLWYSGRGEWAKAWRRLSADGVPWRGMRIQYPTPARLARLLQPCFRVEQIAPLGAILPPSYVGPWLEARPHLLRHLTRLEQAAHRWSVLASLADHYVVEASRLGDDSQ